MAHPDGDFQTSSPLYIRCLEGMANTISCGKKIKIHYIKICEVETGHRDLDIFFFKYIIMANIRKVTIVHVPRRHFMAELLYRYHRKIVLL